MASISLFLLTCTALCNALVYKSEPEFFPEGWNITHLTNDKSLLAPGYIFLGPLTPNHAWGPQIYDSDGHLIFAGGDRRIQDFTRCDYLGERENHLCFHESRYDPDADPRLQKRDSARIQKRDDAPRPVGKKIVLDNTYSHMGSNFTNGIGSGETKNWPNGHEFNMLPGGESFLQAVYRPTKWDLRKYKGQKDGYILDGCFQEISVRTGEAIFQWCFSDHVDLWKASLFFVAKGQKNATSTKAGTGKISDPWDYVHLNAVDKNDEGDYFVSGRHFDQILKVAGPNNRHGREPGSVIWRVGGKDSDFGMEGGLLFTKQHAVRVVSTTAEETTLSFFNNAWEGTNKPSAKRSAGMIIAVNNVTMTARLLHEYPHPDGLLGRAMGSMQVLPNGNALVGWGFSPQITEFHQNGTVLWHAWYNLPDWKRRKELFGMHEWTYRAFKYTWEGKPHWKPKMLAYARRCSKGEPAPLMAHASWNGATAVATWRFSVAESQEGPWMAAGTKVKRTFETHLELSGEWQEEIAEFMPWVMAEALGEDGEVMGSTISKTWVPLPGLARHCTDYGCWNDGIPGDGTDANRTQPFDYPEYLSCAWACEGANLLSGAILMLVLIFIECTYFFTGNFCRKTVELEMQGDFRQMWGSIRSGQAFRGAARYRDVSPDPGSAKRSPSPGRRKSLESQMQPLQAPQDEFGRIAR